MRACMPHSRTDINIAQCQAFIGVLVEDKVQILVPDEEEKGDVSCSKPRITISKDFDLSPT